MGDNEVIRVKIFGNEYKIKPGEQSTQYISKLSEYVDKKLIELNKIFPNLSEKKLAILSCLNMADEYFHLKNTLQNNINNYNKQENLDVAKEIIDKINKILSEN